MPRGVRQRFSRPIEAIERAGDGSRSVWAAASVYPCDIALLCIGTQANTPAGRRGYPGTAAL